MIKSATCTAVFLAVSLPMAISGASFAGDSAGDWELEFSLTTGNNTFSVDISGSQAIVGQRGAAVGGGVSIVYQQDPDGSWDEGTVLPIPSGVINYGESVAIDGDIAVVGASPGGSRRVVIHERSPQGVWGEPFLLSGPGNSFGEALDIEGGTLVVGAPAANNSNAYVFIQGEDGEWILSQTLQGCSGLFGTSIDLSGDSLLIGGPSGSGCASLFARSVSGDWVLENVFTNSSVFGLGGAVGVDGDTVVVGGSTAQRAVVWERDGAGWSEGTLLPGGGPQFSTSVAIEGDQILVGQPIQGGSVVSYERGTEGTWALKETLPGFGSQPGHSLAISNDQAIVGGRGAFGIYSQSNCPGEKCIADLNCDGVVNGSDLTIMLNNWGLIDTPANISGEGPVNGSDLTILLSQWGLCP
jgi:hypothetical protein